jgi:hypothetical protein
MPWLLGIIVGLAVTAAMPIISAALEGLFNWSPSESLAAGYGTVIIILLCVLLFRRTPGPRVMRRPEARPPERPSS